MSDLISSFLISPYFYYVYSGILIFVFYRSYKKILKPYFEAKKSSGLVVEVLEEIRNNRSSIQDRIKDFDDWVLQNNHDPYIKTCIEPAWKYYHSKYSESLLHQVEFTPDVYDFFTEDQFIHKYGRRKLVEAIPSIFLAAGIFGTFLSIAVGVSLLNINGDAVALKDGIGSLLQGMQGKFLSSLIGIALSISWQLLDKIKCYPILSESFYQVRQKLDDIFPTRDESQVLFQLMKNEESRHKDYQAIITNQIIPAFSKSLGETLTQTIVPALEKEKNSILDLQKQGVEDMVHLFVDSLTNMTGDYFKDLGESLQQTIEWQKQVHHEVSGLVKHIEESAQHQMEIGEKNSIVSQQLVDYADRLERTVVQFTDVTDRMNIYQTEVAHILDNLLQERDLFHEFYDKHMFNLQSDIDTIQNLTKQQVEYQNNLEENIKLMSTLSNSQLYLSKSLTDQAEHSQSMTRELNKTVYMMQNHGSMFAKLQSQVKDQFDSIFDERKKQSEIYKDMLDKITEQATLMDQRANEINNIWNSTTQILSKSMNQFSNDMNHFSVDMNQGLEQALNQIDSELAKSVDYLTKSTSAIQYGVSDLPKLMQELKHSLDQYHEKVTG